MDTIEKSLALNGWQQIEANTFQKETSGEVLKLSVKPINMNEFYDYILLLTFTNGIHTISYALIVIINE